MKKNSTAFQVFSSVGTKFIVLFGSFIISIILARYLGPEGKGIVTAIFVIPNLLVSIADLGIRQATAYYVGKKIFSPSSVYGSIIGLWIITSLLSVIIATIYYLTGPSEQYGWPLLMVPLATLPLLLLNKYTEGMFLGLQKVNIINVKLILGFVVNLVLVVILILVLDLGVYGAALITLLVALATLLYSLVVLRKSITSISYEKEIGKTLLGKGIVYAIALFVLNLNYKIDIVFLERLTTPEDVGIYSIGVNLTELIWQIPAAMGMVLFSKSATTNLKVEAVNRSTRLLRISWIPVVIFSIFFWLLAPYIIQFLYGVEFINAVSVIRLLLPGVLAMVLFKLLNADLAGRGYPLFALKVYIIALVINIVLNLLLIPHYGINGAAFASTVSYSIGAFLFSIAYYKHSKIKYLEMFILEKTDLDLIKVALSKFIKKMKKGN